METSRQIAVPLLFCLTLLPGCWDSGHSGGPNVPSPALNTASGNTQPMPQADFTLATWEQGQPDVALSTNAGFAAFAEIRGTLSNSTDKIQLVDSSLGGKTTGQLLASAIQWKFADPEFLATETQTFSWSAGDPSPVQMIHKDDGFCVLAEVEGTWDGTGEYVRVYLKPDGYWYLEARCTSGSAKAIAIRTAKPGTFGGHVYEYSWTSGQSPVRLFSKDAGICFVSGLGGKFSGLRDGVNVQLSQDGYWYLNGLSRTTVQGRAIGIRYDNKEVPIPVSASSLVTESIDITAALSKALADVKDEASAATSATKIQQLSRQWSEFLQEARQYDKDAFHRLTGRKQSSPRFRELIADIESQLARLRGKDEFQIALDALATYQANVRLTELQTWTEAARFSKQSPATLKITAHAGHEDGADVVLPMNVHLPSAPAKSGVNRDYVALPVFSPDGRWFALSCWDKRTHIYNGRTGLPAFTLAGLPHRAFHITFSHDGRLVAINGGGEIGVWDLEQETPHSVVHVPSKQFGPIVFSPSGYVLASTNRGCVSLLNMDDRSAEHFFAAAEARGAGAVAFLPEGGNVAVGHGVEVVVWDRPTHSYAKVWPTGGKRVSALGVLKDGPQLVAWHDQLVVYDPTTGVRVTSRTLTNPPQGYGASFSADGRFLVHANRGTGIHIHDVVKDQDIHLPDKVSQAALSPDNQMLLVYVEDQARLLPSTIASKGE